LAVALGMLVAGLSAAALAPDSVRISGTVEDGTGAALPGARVKLLTAQQVMAAATRTDGEGRFELSGLRAGSYLLVVEAEGFATHRLLLRVAAGESKAVVVRVNPAALEERVTVTANPGQVEDTRAVSQAVNVIDSDAVLQRAKAVVAQTAEEEVGVHLQRTSPTLAGIYVRGLTGNKVNVFVDGVRFSTSAQRGGINTFLDLISPPALQAVEILRGPSSAQYGSDALGGSVQMISRSPEYSAAGGSFRGRFSAGFNSADASVGSHLSTSYAGRTVGLTATVAGQRVNRLRPGGGLDSHSAFTRFLGLPSNIFLSDRLPDTAFTQYGGVARLGWTPSAGTQLILHYHRSQQDGGRRADQLLGGDGNLVADLNNLMLDFFYARYDRARAGWFDHFTAAYSFNTQREERRNQGGNGNPLATITHEYERTNAHGLQASVGKRLGERHELLFGGEYYHERISSPSFGLDPASGTASVRRGRVPDRARYQSGGAFAQDVMTLLEGRLRLAGTVRWSAAAYRSRAADSPLVGGQPLWPDDSLWTSSVTFRGGVVARPLEALSFSANVGRGYRAPHVTDLGTLGLTGSGFEVAAPDVAGLGAAVGTTADAQAVSTGRAVRQVDPETSLSAEFGAHVHMRRFRSDFVVFLSDIYDNITKQALILPPGAVGQTLGGETIVAQNPNGVVFVAASSSPVLVRTNFDDARVWGIEHTADWQVASNWRLRSVFTYIHAADQRSGQPPNIEGGTPAPDGWLKLLYSPGRWWVEPYLHGAWRQTRLSSLDLEDRRTGATRSVDTISNFFFGGATARGFVGPGLDGTLGTGDDVLLATGETLAEILARVLGGAESSPLFRAVPGYVTVGVRGGVRLGERQQVLLDFSNIGDRNYRGISWGLDGAGRNVSLRYLVDF
jgi:outer membrane receptor protein involved in Fe transport